MVEPGEDSIGKEIEINDGRGRTNTFRVFHSMGSGGVALLESQIRTMFRLPRDQAILLEDPDGGIVTLVYDTIMDGEVYTICKHASAPPEDDDDTEEQDEDIIAMQEEIENYVQNMGEKVPTGADFWHQSGADEVSFPRSPSQKSPSHSMSPPRSCTTKEWTPSLKKPWYKKKQKEPLSRRLEKLSQKVGLTEAPEEEAEEEEVRGTLTRNDATGLSKAIAIMDEIAQQEEQWKVVRAQALAPPPPPETPMENATRPGGRLKLLITGLHFYRKYASHHPSAAAPYDHRATRLEEAMQREHDRKELAKHHPDEAPVQQKLVDLMTSDKIVIPTHRLPDREAKPPPEITITEPHSGGPGFVVEAIREWANLGMQKATGTGLRGVLTTICSLLVAPLKRLREPIRENKKLSFLICIGVGFPILALSAVTIWITHFDGESERGDGPKKLKGGG